MTEMGGSDCLAKNNHKGFKKKTNTLQYKTTVKRAMNNTLKKEAQGAPHSTTFVPWVHLSMSIPGLMGRVLSNRKQKSGCPEKTEV